MTEPRRTWTFKRVIGAIALILVAVIVWSGTSQTSSQPGRVALLGVAVGLVALALRPYFGPALLIGSFMALSVTGNIRVLDIFNLTAMVFGVAGSWLSLRRIPLLAGFISSFFVWAMSDAIPGAWVVAIPLMLAGPLLGLWRLISSRSAAPDEQPLPHLARGPLVAVPSRVFEFQKGRVAVRTMAIIASLGVPVGGVLLLMGFDAAGVSLALVGAILGLTFWMSLWFTTRNRFRIDAFGLHRRLVLREESVPWQTISGLTLRRVLMRPRFGTEFLYYCVQSPTREFAFPNTLTGARELRDLIEQATGMQWEDSGFAMALPRQPEQGLQFAGQR